MQWFLSYAVENKYGGFPMRRPIRRLGLRPHTQGVVLAAVLVCFIGDSWSQTAAALPTQAERSISAPVRLADEGGIELHFLYVHGIGVDVPKDKIGTQDFQVSREFRTSLCGKLGCTNSPGKLLGRNYASAHLFELNNRPPLEYLRQPVWRTDEEWNAAAPFVDHYELTRKHGATVYVDEINWWPLVLSAKCRQIIATDAGLVDKDEKHLRTCSVKTESDEGQRYKAFDWLEGIQIEDRKTSWPRGAVLNRWLKHDVLDWDFADAVLAVGPLRKYLLEGIRETILDSYNPSVNQGFVIVSHSLGSYLMFSALDINNDPTVSGSASQSTQPATGSQTQTTLSLETIQAWKMKFDDVLKKTSHAYFMANQLSLLELSNLDDSKGGNLMTHLNVWAELRLPKQAYVVAFSDPDDLLTWQVPDAQGMYAPSVQIENLPALNAHRWLWLFANPIVAHTTYDINKSVVRVMLPKEKPRPEKKDDPTK
jgi:hypothetical protein